MDKKELKRIRVKAYAVKRDIEKNKLKDFNLKWFTKPRIAKIENLIEDCQKLRELGMTNEVLSTLENTLLYILMGWGFEYHKKKLPLAKLAWHHLWGKKKTREGIVNLMEPLKTKQPLVINQYLDQIIIQIEHFEKYEIAVDKEEYKERRNLLIKYGYPVNQLHEAAEIIILNWGKIDLYIENPESQEPNNNNLFRIYFLKSMSNPANIDFKLFKKESL